MTRVVLWIVTLMRVVLIPVFVLLATRAQDVAGRGGDPTNLRYVAMGVLVTIGVSDVLDGWIARRFDLATQVGAIVDAAADKLVQVFLVAFFTLSRGAAYAALPIWFLAILVGRDAVLGGGMLFARSQRVPITVVHRAHGRATSILVFVILGWITFGLPRALLPFLVAATSVLVLGSSGAYLRDGVLQARDVLRARRASSPGR